MKKNTFFTLCLSLFLLGTVSAQQTVWVAATASGAANGTSEADAYGSLATALFDINSAGDILRVVGTVPAGAQNLSLTSATSINKNFQYTIEGDAGGSTLTGTNGLTRMFTINAASAGQNVTFKNITFSGSTGSTGAGGSVLFTNQANVTINFENCRFIGNSLASSVTVGGGALNITNSTVTIMDCLFKENQALQNGGAIAIYNTSNVTMTGCTFYKNKTTSATAAQGGGALFVTDVTAVVNAYNCTFFQNTTGLTNQDYGVIRTDSGTTKIYNSLFYDNKLNNDQNAPSDWGAGTNGTQTFETSIAQWISTNVDNQDEGTGSITGIKGGTGTPADLTSSNLTFNPTTGKVEYDSVSYTEDSPIDFGSDGNDVGAWDSGLTLSLDKEDFLATKLSVYYNGSSKNLEVLHSIAEPISLEVYTILGAKVLSLNNVNAKQLINANHLNTGIYILVGKTSEKFFSKKFLIN